MRPYWSLVAGFLDPAENLEEAVRREIREESSLEVGHIRYFGLGNRLQVP